MAGLLRHFHGSLGNLCFDVHFLRAGGPFNHLKFPQFLQAGFEVMAAWGFKYLAPITWVKPSGMGNYFVHRTQTVLFGYKEKCIFPLARYKPTVLIATDPHNHSEKPGASYDLIESISPEPRIELFARARRFNWSAWGNEVESDIVLIPKEKQQVSVFGPDLNEISQYINTDCP